MSEHPNLGDDIDFKEEITNKEDQFSDEPETTQITDQNENVIRLGRVSAFGPSLDGGFGIND